MRTSRDHAAARRAQPDAFPRADCIARLPIAVTAGGMSRASRCAISRTPATLIRCWHATARMDDSGGRRARGCRQRCRCIAAQRSAIGPRRSPAACSIFSACTPDTGTASHPADVRIFASPGRMSGRAGNARCSGRCSGSGCGGGARGGIGSGSGCCFGWPGAPWFTEAIGRRRQACRIHCSRRARRP